MKKFALMILLLLVCASILVACNTNNDEDKPESVITYFSLSGEEFLSFYCLPEYVKESVALYFIAGEVSDRSSFNPIDGTNSKEMSTIPLQPFSYYTFELPKSFGNQSKFTILLYCHDTLLYREVRENPKSN